MRPIPPAAVALTFVVKEGPKVKVGKITFTGNKALSNRELQSAMKNLKPIGIPHSIFLENLFPRTYDSTKLNEDAERVRYFYQTKGYFKALVADPQTQIHDTSGVKWYWPFKSSPGKAVDIKIPVEEGPRYRLKEITFTGNKAVTDTSRLRPLFKIKDGDVFDTEAIRKGLDSLRKAYAALGYINFTPVPNTEPDDEKKLISLAHRSGRRQAVLCPPHRVSGQYHHSRQGHSPRAGAGRRPGLQRQPVGVKFAAPEPVAVFRGAQA